MTTLHIELGTTLNSIRLAVYLFSVMTDNTAMSILDLVRYW